MDRIDLHTHSTCSDGSDTPPEVVRRAVEAGLVLVALTDHDTTEGLQAAAEAGRELGIEVLAGCEVSTVIPEANVHILAYGFDPADEGLQALLARTRADRDGRNVLMRDRLAELGFPLELDEVAAHATGSIVARPHFARAMLERGWVTSLQEAYDRWIGDDGPGYIMAPMPRPEVAIRAIVAAGGVASLAHPKQLRLGDRRAYADLLERLVAAGLAGLEVDHPSHTAWHRRFFSELATAFHLVPTGGSDYHGAFKPNVAVGVGDGTIHVQRETWDRLASRRGGAGCAH